MDAISREVELTLRTLAMPADANPAGDIFGGWVMSQMDLAAFVRSSEIASGRTVTVAVHEISFKRPVKIGDTLCVYTRIEKIGRTSITLSVEAWTKRYSENSREKVTEAKFVMVAVDAEGKPRLVIASGGDQAASLTVEQEICGAKTAANSDTRPLIR